MIPKIIHQTHYDQNLPLVADCKKTIENTNPSWEYKFWSNQMAEKLVRENFPQYSDQWLSLENKNIIKWNLFRFMLIYAEGGMYVDCDTIFRKSIDEVINFNVEFIGVKKHCFDIWIKDHFFLAEKHSQFLYSCIDKIFKQLMLINPSKLGVTSHVHHICGGFFLNKQLELYSRSGGDFYELLNPKCITNIDLRGEGYKNQIKANQEFNWDDVYVMHLMEGSWSNRPLDNG